MKHHHFLFGDIALSAQHRKINLRLQNNLIIIFIINKLDCFYQHYEKVKVILGMAIAKCLGSSSNFSITNKHRMMGEHSR